MTDYLTEQEQIEQIKKWLKQYGPTIIVGVVLAVIITVSWHTWQNHRTKTLLNASVIYDEMLTARAQSNEDTTLKKAKDLIASYSNTPYAQIAAMMLARNAVLQKDYPEAVTQLTWVIDHSHTRSIKQIARIRIARIYITEKKAERALDLLKKIEDTSFKGLIDEVRGDAYYSLNDPSSARKAYALALQEIPNAEVTRPILQMKYDNLAPI